MSESDPNLKSGQAREEALFEAAAQLNGSERASFLNGACHGDAALRQRLEALLAAHEQTDALLATEGEAPRPTIKLEIAHVPDEAVGQTIGRYKVLQPIGEGGCGVVYMAEQLEPVRRRVALKVIKVGMDTKAVVARFEAERQALALMDHPNIAKVLDAGATETGRPYFVMELVKGIPITRYCDENNLSTATRLGLFVQVCQAIQHAHQKGIIHRDIKPSNVLVADHDGVPVPKIIDFGIAKATTDQRLTDKTLFTAFEQFIGTPAYMSPEQAKLSGLDIDTRSDIYSLGVLLYELLTGKTPFEAKRLLDGGLDEIRRIIREEEPMRPSTRLDTLDAAEQTTVARHRQSDPPRLAHLIRGDLDWIVMKALEKDRGRRYETANGLAMDIQRHLNNEPVVACPPSNLYRLQKMARRHKLAFWAGAAVAASLLAGLAISSWLFIKEKQAWSSEARMRQRAEEAQLRAQAEASRASTASAQATASEQKARKALSASEFRQGTRLISEKKPGPALAFLTRSLKDDPSNSAALTSIASLLASHSWMVPTLQVKPATAAEFSPDGGRILTAAEDVGASVWDVRSGQQICRVTAWTLPPHSPPPLVKHAVNPAHFSADGKLFATASWDQARIWDAQTGQPVTELLQHNAMVTVAEFSPDQSRLATVCGPAIWIWDVANGRKLMQLTNDVPLAIGFAQYSPDGKRLLGVLPGQGVLVWDAATGRIQSKLEQSNPTHSGLMGIKSAQFSPDGRQIVTATEYGVSQVWDAETGEPGAKPWQHLTELVSAQFSPDGKRIVTATVAGAISMQDAATGNGVPGLPGQYERPNVVRFSRDGRRIVTAAGAIARIWDAQSGKPLTEPLQHSAVVHAAQFSPDGQRLLTTARDGRAQVWELQNISPPSPLLLRHGPGVKAAQFSADGSLLLTASDDAVRIWDAWTGLAVTKPLRHRSAITAARFSPDAQRFLTASLDKTVQIWEARTGNKLGKALEHPAGLFDAAFSPDGARLVTAVLDGTAWEWDVASGQPLLAQPMKQSGWLASACFSPDGTKIITASQDGTAGIWDAQTGQSLGQLKLKGDRSVPMLSADFSPDARRILTVSKDGTTQVWDAQSGAPLLRLDAAATAAQFSPGGKCIVTISAATARVWDAENGRPMTDPVQPGGAVNSARFSPDSQRVVTTEAGASQVWDAYTGEMLAPTLRHDRYGPDMVELWDVGSAEFSPDGGRVVTTAADGYARVWDIAPSPQSAPGWLRELAETISGQILDERGLLQPSELNRAEVLARLRQELNANASQDAWSIWGRWFLSDAASRAISPFARQTLAQYVDSRIAEGTEAALALAEEAAQGNSALLKLALEARAKLKRAKEIAASRQQVEACYASGQNDQAIALMGEFCEAHPSDTEASLILATWQTWFGQDSAYQATRRRLVLQAEGTDQASTAERATKAYCLRPSTDNAMLTKVLELAQSAVELGKSDPWLPYYQLGLGLAEFRSGQYAAAEQALAVVEQTAGDYHDPQRIARPFRAMSLFRQDKQAEARKLLNQAEADMPPLPKDESKPLVDGKPASHDVLILWLAYKEARSIVNSPAGAKP